MLRFTACLCLIAIVLTGCGGGGSSSGGGSTGGSPIVVTITPPSASLALNGTKQFIAAAANTTNQGVIWSVVEGASGGAVTTSGMYTAPLNLAGTFHVKATSQADGSKNATVSVTVHPGILVTPTPVTLNAGQSQLFTASVVGTAVKTVTWTVQEGAAGGSVTSTGSYTAPSGSSGTFHVIATCQADPTQTATATITVPGGGLSYTIQ